MREGVGTKNCIQGLGSRKWLLSYKTSVTKIEGRPIDMLYDFYVPALKLATRYDRVAGYFRSSSLAAASQGYTSFIGRNGKMRLIVGADLQPADVKAILAGSTQRLAEKLGEELEGIESWTRDVQNGVKLLAWMVAKGCLEVKVAFRVHIETGEPLPFESIDDGYVHEKWFIMYDEFGNRLYGAGSLNESKTGLVKNAENIEVNCDWRGETDKQRVEEAIDGFENLWEGNVDHLPVYSLPEAVRRKLISFAKDIDVPEEIYQDNKAKAPSAMELLQFALLRDGPKLPNGRYVGMETAPVNPWPHQKIVVRRLVETWPYSYLLCDEVGLGKTIEAGLAFRSLHLSGLVKRILIAAPASLTAQWQREMANKMLMAFGLVRTAGSSIVHDYIFPTTHNTRCKSPYEPDKVIMSTGLLARSERAAAIRNSDKYDVVLVDEAHAARRGNPNKGASAVGDFGYLYKAIKDFVRKHTKGLWLATATPMQIDPVEVCDLLALTNRVGAFQLDPALITQYYELLGKAIKGESPNAHEWAFLRRTVNALKMQDPILWRSIEDNVIDSRIRLTAKQWLENSRNPRGKDIEFMGRLLFSTSPLSRVMLRHTRPLLEIYRERGQLEQNLAKRHILPLPRIVFPQAERAVYEKLEEYCRGLAYQITKHSDSKTQQMVSFLLSFLRLRFASSLYAFKQTLQRRLSKVEATLRHELDIVEAEEQPINTFIFELFHGDNDEDELDDSSALLKNRSVADLEWEQGKLKELLDSMASLTGPSKKLSFLMQTLDKRLIRGTQRYKQTVIFTRFFDTLTDIVTQLRRVNPQMLIGTYSGQGAVYNDPNSRRLITVDREDVKERFLRGEIDVLICTDAAAEGLNLQTADLLINYDLGWNPMKIEQRIGRIDRIGQRHKDIFVLNLCYVGSTEEVVYGRLLKRLEDANLIVGTQQISLLPVKPEDFEKLADGSMSPEELERIALERLTEQRKRTENMEIQPAELYETYSRLSKNLSPAPVNLATIWNTLTSSQYLKSLGSKLIDESIFEVSGVDRIPEGTKLTVSSDLYEEGLSDGSRLHFASYGNQYFAGIIQHISRFDLPQCVKRLTVPIPGLDDVEMVAYAVKCISSSGATYTKLITDFSQLEGLRLAEEESIDDTEVEALRKKLIEIAREKYEPLQAAERIERENIRAGKLQELLNLLVIQNLLAGRAKFAGENPLYNPVYKEVEALYEDRDNIFIPDLPARFIRPYGDQFMFEIQVPKMGTNASIDVPKLLGSTAAMSASRVVSNMKVRLGDLELTTVLRRIQNEINLIIRGIH